MDLTRVPDRLTAGNSAASSNAREVCATGLPPCWSESVFQSGMITSYLRRILGHGGTSRGYQRGRSGLSHSMDPHTTNDTLNLLTRGTQVAQCCTSCSARRACGGGHGRRWSKGPKPIPACRRSTLLERPHVQGLVEGRRRRSHCSTRVVDASDETISKSAASTETRDVASTPSTAPSIVTGRRPSTADSQSTVYQRLQRRQ